MRKQFVIAIIFLLSCFSVVVCGQTYKDVTTSHSGELASLLGEEVNGIDSLVVRGPINSDDFYTMWQASFYGNLSVINLENANVENGVVPKDAFWHQSEQLEPDGQYIDCIHLRRIIFPEGVVEIGNGAFSYCIYLEVINIPSTLRHLNNYAFSDCIRLKTDPLVFPEGMEEIANMAFLNCRSLTGEVVLPSTMKTIGNGSFFSCKITKVNLPEGLKEIGDAAFYACRLKEIHIPNSCLDLTGSSHVQLNLGLEKIHLPEGITTIPSLFACYCRDLKEVNIPASVKVIKNSAFEYCKPLRFLCLPEGLERIEGDAFYYVSSLEEVVFPSTLKSLGDNAFDYCRNLKRVYCAATIPPTCEDNPINPGDTPFGSYNDNELQASRDIPLYVPIGSAELYRNIRGWDFFRNIIETDEFPETTSIHSKTIEPETCRDMYYDLNGRKIDVPVKGRIFDLQGRPIQGSPKHGVYIQNGKKVMR